MSRIRSLTLLLPASLVLLALSSLALAEPASGQIGAASASGVFPDTQAQTMGLDVAVDPAGGVHIAYAAYRVTAAGTWPGYYGYCAPGLDCHNRANWQVTTVIDDPQAQPVQAQIEVTPSGQPRILYYTGYGASQYLYVYAECATACSAPAQWTATAIVADTRVLAGLNYDYRHRHFALDQANRPAFIYEAEYTDGGNTFRGTHIARCGQAPCSDAANRYGFRISSARPGSFTDYGVANDYSTLAFTSSGGIRLLTYWFVNPGQSVDAQLAYLSCDAGCDALANWSTVLLGDQGFGKTPAHLVLDSQSRPRVVWESGYPSGGSSAGHHTYHLWCDSNCVNAGSWNYYDIGLPIQPDDLSLALDASGRPAIAYDGPGGDTGYGVCASNCQSANAAWSFSAVDTSAALLADWYLPTWITGYSPSISIGGGRTAIGAYARAAGNYACPTPTPTGPSTGTCTGEYFRAVRVAVLGAGSGTLVPTPQPTATLDPRQTERLYLPTLRR